jgi:VWFA-related protein
MVAELKRNATCMRLSRTMKGCLILVLAATACAQEPRFTTHAREVIVSVSVTTKSGRPVEGLTASDFFVLDDGKPQTVRMMVRDTGTLPIQAVIVVETDAASEPALAKIKKTAPLISSYLTNDMGTVMPSLAAVVTAADELRVALPFTADPDALGDAFARLRASGGASRLLDGVSLACDLLASRKESGRRLIVLIGESRDLDSKARFADVLLKAQKADIVIYTISYSAFTTAFTQKASDRPEEADQPGSYDPNNKGGMNLLAIPALLAQFARLNVAEALAQATGGGRQKMTTLHGLETDLIAIGHEVHNRYLLTFVPPKPQPAGYHMLSVHVRNSKDWRVHARAGYWSDAE